LPALVASQEAGFPPILWVGQRVAGGYEGVIGYGPGLVIQGDLGMDVKIAVRTQEPVEG
jgi:hypothetical protein